MMRYGSAGAVVAFALALVQPTLAANATSTSVQPLSIPPDQSWDGNDGPWSSFAVQLGTPAQTLRLLPATAQSGIWAVIPDGCSSNDGTNCDHRGRDFFINESSTWTNRSGDASVYNLNLPVEEYLNYTGYYFNGWYGYDTLTLGLPGDGLPTMENQVVAGIALNEFYMGILGMSPRPVNFTTLEDSSPSILQTLRNESKVTSSSFGYTAGAYNNVPKVFGSLTFGGYDQSRFTANNVTFPFGPDQSRDLLVALQSITVGSTALLPEGGFYFIDSLVPYIYLPEDACTAFEKAFGLTYNDTAKLYLIDDDLHNKLTSENPTFSFKVGPALSGESVEIQMPYSSFDLLADWPLVDNQTRYFPLQRAENDTQYVLGRTFLQNAYIIADYDRSNFTVAQATMPDTASTSQQLVAILAPANQTSSGSESGTGISGGAIAGIVVGAVIVIAIVLVAVFLVYRRRRKAAAVEAKKTDDEEVNPYAKVELDASEQAKPMMHDQEPKAEMEADGNTRFEMEEPPIKPGELHAEDSPHFKPKGLHSGPFFEMAANEDVILPELDSPAVRSELPTPDPKTGSGQLHEAPGASK